MKISIIGCGHVGGGMAHRFAQDHILYLYDHHHSKIVSLANFLLARACASIEEVVSCGEVVILAVKPSDFESLAEEMRPVIQSNQVIISVLAGVPLQTLREKLGSRATVIRIMPNLALTYGKAVIGIAEDETVDPEVSKQVVSLLSPLGYIQWIPESQMNALTALTGSGPAFIFAYLEAMVQAGVAMGFEESASQELVLETLYGALKLKEETGHSFKELIEQVSSPGGTTQAGMKSLEDGGFTNLVTRALEASRQRADELSH